MRLFRPARRPLLAGLIALFAIVLGAIGTVANAMPAVPKPAPPGASVLSPHAATDPPYDKTPAPWGPDVSGWQHPAGGGINWAAVRGVGASYFHSSRAELAALAKDAVKPTTRPYGAIGAKWAALGGASGFLGKPLNNEHGVAGVAGARMEDFAGGTIYWSAAAGAHEVHGGIRAKYRVTGNAANYGLPVTDESKTPDGIGRYNHFTGGRSIYWTPSTDAHLVYGAIRAKWASMGWERGRLGYPTTDEYAVTGGRRNEFQHGSITWASPSGMVTVVYQTVDMTISGQVEHGVEGGCMILRGDAGKTWLLVGGDRNVLQAGARVVVRGYPDPHTLSYCIQGMVFKVTEVHRAS